MKTHPAARLGVLLLLVVLVFIVSAAAILLPGVPGFLVLPLGLGLVGWLAYRTRTVRFRTETPFITNSELQDRPTHPH